MFKDFLVSSNSPKKRTKEFVVVVKTNSFVHFLGELEETKKSFRNYLTFSASHFMSSLISEENFIAVLVMAISMDFQYRL